MKDTQTLLHTLHDLYADASKHSVYQNVPEFVKDAVGYTEKINEAWRGDTTRWRYMSENIDFDKRSLLDVGANTGFFTLSLAHKFKDSQFTALEGNQNHSNYIDLVARNFDMSNVNVRPQYLTLGAIEALPHFDDALLYNVLHHAGVDFDQDCVADRESLFPYLVDYMDKFGEHCDRVVFQMGYNWGGNKSLPIVELEDDAGKLVYTAKFMRKAGWTIESIASSYPLSGDIPVVHKNLPAAIIESANNGDEAELRNGAKAVLSHDLANFSEFYRRPIFVCNRS